MLNSWGWGMIGPMYMSRLAVVAGPGLIFGFKLIKNKNIGGAIRQVFGYNNLIKNWYLMIIPSS